jgi:L-amino acid N-acyltransferase YncA
VGEARGGGSPWAAAPYIPGIVGWDVVPMQAADWSAVREIYAAGIATGDATFETTPPSWEQFDRSHPEATRLVARDARGVVGFAVLTPVSDRCVYAGVAEVSVYVAAAVRGSGVGRALLERLIRASEEAGIWTLQAGIFPENLASLALHRCCGFREVGVRERLGRMGSRWRNVLMLERRSRAVGVD